MKSQQQVLEFLLPIIEKHGACYQKIMKVKAKKAEVDTQVITRTNDGIETKNKAKNGDWLVENQTEAKEQYLVSEKVFSQKYLFLEQVGDWGIFKPKGRIIAVQFNDSLFKKEVPEELIFEAPWGEKMRLRTGDFLVCPPDKSEVYRIAQKEFSETYAPC